MASTTLSSSVLKAKFRGCMIGVSIGDCLGVPFEFEGFIRNTSINIILPTKKRLCNFMIDLMNEEAIKEFHYSDDTAMTISVASSLAEKGEMNAKDMAERFVAAYFKEDRGYGPHVRTVFEKLAESKFTDLYKPASEQFNGSGSFGNGAPMRIAPIALFGYDKGEEYIMAAAKECSLITHAHPNGYRGGILQCLAVHAALRLDSSQELDPVSFIDNLLEKMEKIETEEHGTSLTSKGFFNYVFFNEFLNLSFNFLKHLWDRIWQWGGREEKPYCESLKKMKEFFLRDQDVSPEEISAVLGNGHDVSALKSVPTAIYSFLRSVKPLKFNDVSNLKSVSSTASSFLKVIPSENYFEISNPFMRAIFSAVSVGGDSDTIGAMTGALAGAYYGEKMIPEGVQLQCEAIDDLISLADKLFDATFNDK